MYLTFVSLIVSAFILPSILSDKFKDRARHVISYVLKEPLKEMDVFLIVNESLSGHDFQFLFNLVEKSYTLYVLSEDDDDANFNATVGESKNKD